MPGRLALLVVLLATFVASSASAASPPAAASPYQALACGNEPSAFDLARLLSPQPPALTRAPASPAPPRATNLAPRAGLASAITGGVSADATIDAQGVSTELLLPLPPAGAPLCDGGARDPECQVHDPVAPPPGSQPAPAATLPQALPPARPALDFLPSASARAWPAVPAFVHPGFARTLERPPRR